MIRANEIEAVINPRRLVTRLRRVPPGELGAAIEPILQRAEERWLSVLRKRRSQTAHARVQAARLAVARGGRVQLPALQRAEHIELLRSIAAGRLPIDPSRRGRMRGVALLRGGAEPRASAFINEPSNPGTVFVPGAGAYTSSIPRHVQTLGYGGQSLQNLSPSRRLLFRVVEPARSEGMLPVSRLGEEMVRTGIVTPGSVIHGSLAPMAFEGATSGSPEAEAQRHERIGNVFRALSLAIRRVNILERPGGHALRRLAIAVEHWLNAHFAANPDPRRIAREDARLVAAFLAFLEFFHGETS